MRWAIASVLPLFLFGPASFGCKGPTRAPAGMMTVRSGDYELPPRTQARPVFLVGSDGAVAQALSGRVAGEDLRHALEDSLRVAGLLATDRPSLVLEAHLEALDPVGAGASRATFSRIRYVFRDPATGSVIGEETIVARFPGLFGTPGVAEARVTGELPGEQYDAGAVRNNLASVMRVLLLVADGKLAPSR